MTQETRFSQEDERACGCLAPYVRRGCDSAPSPAVLAAIHAAAAGRGSRQRILPFVHFAYAAAAMLMVSLAGWLLIRSSMAADSQRQVALRDDMLFLGAGDQPAAESAASDGKREDLARRLLNLQGLDAVTLPATESTAAERSAPLSKDPQSHNTSGLRAQRCG